MSSTLYSARRAHGGPARQRLIGGGAALAVGAALVAVVMAQPRAAAPVAPPPVGAPPAPTGAPIEGYAVEGTQGYEWRIKSAIDGYAIVDGPFGYEVVGSGPTPAAPIDGLAPARARLGDDPSSYAALPAPADDDHSALYRHS